MAVSTDSLRISGEIEIEHILSLKIDAGVNEHAEMTLYGMLKPDFGEKYERMALAGKEITLTSTDKKARPYFSGIIQKATIVNENRVSYIRAVCVSGSIQFDKIPKSRSFQDVNMTYKSMLKQVESALESGGNIVVIAGVNEAIGQPVIQYEETGWAFAKRIASRFNTVVIPEITNTFPQISVGVVNGEIWSFGQNAEYKVGKKLDAFREKSGVHPCSQNDCVYYEVKDDRNCQLGDKVSFHGYPLIVVKKRMELVAGLLEIWYTLGKEAAFGLTRYTNRKISGAALEGKVVSTQGELLKVSLDIDGGDDQSAKFDYRYAPLTSTVMYSMPELGARVQLYFQSSEDSDAVISGCVRRNGDSLPTHKTKLLLTPHKKSMWLAPNYFMLKAQGGGSTSLLRLSDSEELCAETSKSVRISAEGGVSFYAGKKVTMSAVAQLRLVHPAAVDEKSYIQLCGGEIMLSAKTIRHSGRSVAYPPVDQNAKRKPRLELPGSVVIGAIPLFANMRTADSPTYTVAVKALGASPQSSGKKEDGTARKLNPGGEVTTGAIREAGAEQNAKVKIYVNGKLILGMSKNGKTYPLDDKERAALSKALAITLKEQSYIDWKKESKISWSTVFRSIDGVSLEEIAQKMKFTMDGASLISRWMQKEDQEIVVLNPAMKYSSIKMVRHNAIFTIHVYTDFLEESDLQYPAHLVSSPHTKGVTLKKVAQDGIMIWDGNTNNKIYPQQSQFKNQSTESGLVYDDFGVAGYVQVFIKLHDKSEGGEPGQQFMPVYCYSNLDAWDDPDVEGDHKNLRGVDVPRQISLNWRFGNAGSVVLVIRNENDDYIDANNQTAWKIYTSREFAKVTAHEFGHAFGLWDAYKTEDGKYVKFPSTVEQPITGTEFNTFYWGDETGRGSMMYNTGIIRPNEIEMIIEALKTNKEVGFFNDKWRTKSEVIRL